MFSSIFRYQGLVWRIMNNITDAIFLSLLWVLCAIPVFTIGAATSALYDAVAHCIRGKEQGIYHRFFSTFIHEILSSMLANIVWLAAAFVGFLTYRFLFQFGMYSRPAAVAAVMWLVVMILPMGAACWTFLIRSRFTFGLGKLLATACKFSIAYLPVTAFLVLSAFGILWLEINYMPTFAFMPMVLMLVWTFVVEPVFARYGGGLDFTENDDNDDTTDSEITK